MSWLTREPDVTITRAEMWMLRLLDAPAAIAGRGFPPAVTLAAGLAVTDPQLPANSGDWHLEISGGAAALTAARSPGPRSASLYALEKTESDSELIVPSSPIERLSPGNFPHERGMRQP